MAREKKIEAELERIRRKNGGILTSERVVREAKDKKSVLHSEFEWNDSVAGHLHRLEQAGALIRCFKTVYIEVKSEVRQICHVYAPCPNAEVGFSRVDDMLMGPERKPFLIQEWQRTCDQLGRFLSFLKTAGMLKTANLLNEAMMKARKEIDGLSEAEAGN